MSTLHPFGAPVWRVTRPDGRIHTEVTWLAWSVDLGPYCGDRQPVVERVDTATMTPQELARLRAEIAFDRITVQRYGASVPLWSRVELWVRAACIEDGARAELDLLAYAIVDEDEPTRIVGRAPIRLDAP